MGGRYDLTDFEWSVIEPLLPNKPRGVPRVDDRRVLSGIFWILPGTRDRNTKGVAMVNPKTPIPTPTRTGPCFAIPPIRLPTIGAVHVKEVSTSVAPMKKTPRNALIIPRPEPAVLCAL